MKRRNFLKLSAGGAGALLTGSSMAGFLLSSSACKKHRHIGLITEPVPVTEGNFTDLLSFPAETGANETLVAQVTSASIGGNRHTVLGYQTSNLLGPTFRVSKGQSVNILLQNNLSEHTNIHWHGLKVPALMDGHPDQLADKGGTFRYQFTVNQRAGLSWYHPHPHEKTGKQVFQGLAGMFIINDNEEVALNLPSGQFELPLVIQDKRLSGGGIHYHPDMEEVMAGYMGESILVNGVFAPRVNVATRFYRLRLLNGSNARVYNLALSNNADLVIIGNDGGLLKKPARVKEILFGPGERLDVLVDFSNLAVGSDVFLVSKTFDMGGDAQGKQEFNIMKFSISSSVTDSFVLPAALSHIPDIPVSSAVKTRAFQISNPMERYGYPMNDGMRMRHRINGKLFDSKRIDETVTANTNEIWVFYNDKGDEPHPMHLHGVFFRVLQRDGGRGALTVAEEGWKDTVLVMPGEIVKILVPFESNRGKFVFHCHNLEHEDDGMMLQYQVN